MTNERTYDIKYLSQAQAVYQSLLGRNPLENVHGHSENLLTDISRKNGATHRCSMKWGVGRGIQAKDIDGLHDQTVSYAERSEVISSKTALAICNALSKALGR